MDSATTLSMTRALCFKSGFTIKLLEVDNYHCSILLLKKPSLAAIQSNIKIGHYQCEANVLFGV